MRRPSALLLALLLATVTACADPAPPGDAALPADAGPRPDAPPVPRPDAGPPPADLEGFVDWQMAVGGIRGLAAAVTHDGAVVLTVTRGMATETTPVDAHTLFITASISKTVTGALLLGLVEEGRLDLDRDVSDYLGFAVRNPAYPDVAITTRMLASHASGLRDDWIELGQNTYDDADPEVGLAEFARAYLTDPGADAHWASEPGTTYEYCNACFGVLGAIVEAASGEDLRARSEARLFDPLALDGAGWFLADVDRGRLADEYTWSESGGFHALPQHGFAFYTASSFRVSVTGLSRWLLAFQADGTLDGATVLSPDSVALTRAVQYPSADPGQGFVWYAIRVAGSSWLGHTGATFGASAIMLSRADGVGVVLLTNSNAYIRSRLGDTGGRDAMYAVVGRLLDETGLR